MGDLHIRPAHGTDLPALVRELGQRPYFADRLSRQRDGRGLLLVAWRERRVIGDVYLWLETAEEPEIREHLPGTPLLTHLEIHADHRHQGAGTRLIEAAELKLALLGHPRVALAVEVTNHGAEKLYHRLGYREWPHPPIRCYALADGEHPQVEICRILVKRLSRDL